MDVVQYKRGSLSTQRQHSWPDHGLHFLPVHSQGLQKLGLWFGKCYVKMALNNPGSFWAVEGLCYVVSHLDVGGELSDLLGDVILEVLGIEEKLKDYHSDNAPYLLMLPVENTTREML